MSRSRVRVARLTLLLALIGCGAYAATTAASAPVSSGKQTAKAPSQSTNVSAFGAVLWSQTTSAAAKPVLTIGAPSTRGNNNPALDTGIQSLGLPGLLANEAPILAGPNGTYLPGLATSWAYVKAPKGSGLANKVFKFTLRHNARFSDGTPVTAQAVKTWFDYVNTQPAPYKNKIGVYGSTTTEGKWTVILHMKAPNANMPFAMTGNNNNFTVICSPRAVADPALFENGTWGAGPYMIDPKQTVANDHYTLVPNPYYYDKSRIKWSKVIIKVITSASSMLQAIQTGQVNVGIGDPSTADAADSAGLKIVNVPGATYTYGLDTGGVKVKALGDVRVRQAMNYAIDRKAVTQAIAGKWGMPTSELASLDGWVPKYVNRYPYNPAKAKALLASAGYPNGFKIDPAVGATIFGTQGVPLLQAVAKYLDDVGIHAVVKSDDLNAFLHDFLTDPVPMIGLPLGVEPQTVLYTLLFKPGGQAPIADPTLGKLWLQGSRAANPTPYWQGITIRMTDQAYGLPIYVGQNLTYVGPKVANVTYNFLHFFNYYLWAPK